MRILPAELEPKLFTVLREGYGWRDLVRDGTAGLVVGIVALPLAIAFGIASGVRPEQGIYTAIVAGMLISLLGGSRVQIGGPTGAFVVVVAEVVSRFGYDGLALACVLAGCLLIVMAFARLGDIIRFIPYPVTVGFTSGIALIIALGQVPEALGLGARDWPGELPERLLTYVEHASEMRGGALALFAVTVAIVQLWPRFSAKLRCIPGPLVALLATTSWVALSGLDVETIQGRFGAVPSSLPVPRIPDFDLTQVPALVPSVIAIALLGSIESLLSAVVADGLVGGRHRSNAELLAQGIANIAAPLFGGIPATGAIARTATNVRNGGRSPIAGVVHSLTLLVILVVAGPWASRIPMATLAGILVVVAYNMSEWRGFVRLLRGPRSDALVLAVTFLLTVLIDLTVAVQVGVVLAALLFMRRMAEVTEVKALRELSHYEDAEEALPGDSADLAPAIEVFEINGSFCFGAARKFTTTLLSLQGSPRVVILRMRHVLAMDATGIHALEEVWSRFEKSGVALILSAVQPQPLLVLQQSGTLTEARAVHLRSSFPEAVAHAREILRER